MIQLRSLLTELVNLANKAADIARYLRQDEHLLQMLTEPKECDASKGHFTCDFKTLADVLIQQMISYRLRSVFTSFGPILGEEDGTLTRTDGQCIQIEMTNDPQQLTNTLNQLIPDVAACKRFVGAILASNPGEPEANLLLHQVPATVMVDESQFGLWIDPIDSTNEYVKTDMELCKVDRCTSAPFALRGLHTVACLLGVYQVSDGQPVIGVMQLPFQGSSGICQWAVHMPGQCVAHNIPPPALTMTPSRIVLFGSDQSSTQIADRCLKEGYKVFRPTGAGYKLWLLINGHADAWIVPTGTVYKWDTCAGHVLLRARHRARHGDIVEFHLECDQPIDYRLEDENNNGHQPHTGRSINGLIAFTCSHFGASLKQSLKSNMF